MAFDLSSACQFSLVSWQLPMEKNMTHSLAPKILPTVTEEDALLMSKCKC